MGHFLLHLFSLLLCVYSIDCSLPSRHKEQTSIVSGDGERNGEVRTWTCPIKVSDNSNLNESRKWDLFLNNLFCKLSEYKLQAAKRNYNVSNAAELRKCQIQRLIKQIQRKKIDKSNFETFLNKLVKCNVMEYDAMKDTHVTEVQIEEFNQVLDVTLRDKLRMNCKEDNVYIKANYITANDIIATLNLKRKRIDITCKKLLSSDKKIFLNIFALNSFFIDANVTSAFTKSHKIVQMSVIAPKWENIGKNKIELKGEDAEPPKKRSVIDGAPGKPGNPGGNFFGIGIEFLNGINLEISVSGGNGSDGLEGRKGENGVDGDTPKDYPKSCSKYNYCDEIHYFECKKDCQIEIIVDSYFRDGGLSQRRTCTYEILGKKGAKGNNGGKGGKGGEGGQPGNIKIIELKDDSQIHQIKNTGQNGADGRGGAGGAGGKKGDDTIVRCWQSYFQGASTKASNEKAQSGQNGLDGGNIQGMENPKSALAIHSLDKARIINEYKSYLRENLHGKFAYYFLNGILNHLETNTDVTKVYNTLGLIDELQHLEDQVHTLNTNLNFIPFYQSFLNRVREYADAPKKSEHTKPYKKVLCYLYTAALSTMHNIEDNLESNLIIDIYAYLSSVKTDIDKITDLKNSKYKMELMNGYEKKYKHEIDKKINEAKELIAREITPEIDNTGSELDKHMKTLASEVVQLKNKSLKDHAKLIEKKHQLENMLVVQRIFSVFKVFGSAVSLLGPEGEMVGSIIEKGSEIASSFVTNDENNQIKALELPKGASEFESITNQIKNTTNKKITCLKNSLKEITNNSDILGNISSKILSINDKLDKLDKNKIIFKEIQTLEAELIAELQKVKSDPKNTKQLEIIKNLGKNVQFCTLLSDSKSDYENNKEELDAISTAIEENEEQFNKIKQYEQNIYDSMTPMLQNIQSDLQGIIDKLGTKSKVSLDVTKWKVETTLRDMIQHMRELTRGFKVEDNLARSLEKLEQAMNALINVHQLIQDYQKDQNLATYIAEISSIAVKDITAANSALQEKLRTVVHNLEITVRSNIVVQRYKIAMSAFKQFVFPFAHNYFKDLFLPPSLTLSDDKNDSALESLVSNAAVELEKIKAKLENYKMTVLKHDGCIGEGDFRSTMSSEPFFVWKNKQHNDMISRLLSGDAVIIKADVRESSFNKDAIKFKFIDFNFKSKNKALQKEINKVLKGFQIFANHLGNSDYRYEDKIYEMMTGSQEIWYYFQKNKHGDPVSFSRSYEKIKNGTEILSPFASWKIKLGFLKRGMSFDALKKYKDSVDLVLEGRGYFLNKGSMNCEDLMIDNYYKAIDSVDSKSETYRADSMYPLQGNTFKGYKVFKRFFLNFDNEDSNYK